MPTSLVRQLPLAFVALIALWLRVAGLDRRPMHADEANQAVKLGELLEKGHYAFDPKDHHGPTLYYAAVPIAWLRGERSLAQLTETTVRLVPALFGTAAVVLLGVLAMPLGRWPALAAAAFLALSPPAVYYSRYFIQETLLLTFTLAAIGCARRWWETRKMGWAIAAGACVGLMQATKATAPLFVAAAVVAAIVAGAVGRAPARSREPLARKGGLKPALLGALGGALFTGALLYSSFFTNFSGVGDALGTYKLALSRFGSAATPTGHEKPWWYYLRLFGWFRDGFLWQQLGFSALAVVGLAIAFCRSPLAPRQARGPELAERAGDSETQSRASALLQEAAIYTLLVVAAFSFFAYKTPWQAIHFVPGMAILAAGALAAIGGLRTGKFVAVPLGLLVCVSLWQQVKLSSYLRPADGRNPYAYVHSSPDVLKLRPLAEAALARSTGQPLRVISEEYWPLPWYFRGLPAVGYWSEPPDDCDGALVVASMAQADAVRTKLHGKYRESFLGLRPGFVCIVFTPES